VGQCHSLKFSLKPAIALRNLSLVDNMDEKKDECFSFSALKKKINYLIIM